MIEDSAHHSPLRRGDAAWRKALCMGQNASCCEAADVDEALDGLTPGQTFVLAKVCTDTDTDTDTAMAATRA